MYLLFYPCGEEFVLIEKSYITSGRNTIIHKMRKIDLLIVNGGHPVVVVSHRGIGVYKGEVPRKRSEAKKAYQEVIDVSSIDDYTKAGTPNFIKVHQDNYI